MEIEICPSFLKSWRIKDYKLLKRYKSKKNQVHLVQISSGRYGTKKIVIKKYCTKKMNIDKELYYLKTLFEKGVRVPELYFAGKKMIMLEYIEGQTLVDFFTNQERESRCFCLSSAVKKVLSEIAIWFDEYYTAAGKTFNYSLSFGDLNSRNFIYTGSKIYAVDLEENCCGIPEEDIGRFCAFALSYKPVFTRWKQKLIIKMISSFKEYLVLDERILREELIKELRSIAKRRKLKIPDNISSLKFLD